MKKGKIKITFNSGEDILDANAQLHKDEKILDVISVLGSTKKIFNDTLIKYANLTDKNIEDITFNDLSVIINEGS